MAMSGVTVSATLITAYITFMMSLAMISFWIKTAEKRGFISRDMNKPGEIYVADGGGLWVLISVSFGLMAIIALNRYISGDLRYIDEAFALITLLLLAGLLGFIDDIFGWKKGLPRWERVVFMAPISLPLVVIKAGYSRVDLPFLGVMELGMLYPLVLVPIGILGAANAFNMIAGYNGLEAGMGLILMVSVAIYSVLKGVEFTLLCSILMASSLLAFLVFNWYPARVFPGNAMTYGVGAFYASLLIIGNMEKFGLLLFTLYFIKFILFLRGEIRGVWKSGVEDFGVPQNDGSIKSPLRGIYSIQHLAIIIIEKLKGKATEEDVVIFILIVQTIISTVLLVLAYMGFI